MYSGETWGLWLCRQVFSGAPWHLVVPDISVTCNMKEHQARKIPRAAPDVSLGAARRAREGLQQRHSRAGSRTAGSLLEKPRVSNISRSFSSPARGFKKKKKEITLGHLGAKEFWTDLLFRSADPSPRVSKPTFFFFFKKTENRRRKCKIALGRHFSVAETNDGRGEWIGSLMRLCKGHLKDSETPGLAVPT